MGERLQVAPQASVLQSDAHESPSETQKLIDGFQIMTRTNGSPSSHLYAILEGLPAQCKEKLIDDEAKAAGSHVKALREGNASMGLLWLPGSTSGMFSSLVVRILLS